MTVTAATIPSFTVEKARVYLDGERYNNGEGFCGHTYDRDQAEGWYEIFSRADEEDGHTHAVELRDSRTGAIIKRTGPSMQTAERSMWRAHRERYPEKYPAHR